MSEEAKAVGEVAKTVAKSLETSEKFGGWLGKYLDPAMSQLAGAFEDKAVAYRLKNRAQIFEKLEKLGIRAKLSDDIRTLDARFSVPLLEALSLESDETLQSVWARYLLNALDPAKPKPDRVLIDVIKRLEPSDWPLLELLFSLAPERLPLSVLGEDTTLVVQAMDRLTACGLFHYEASGEIYIVATGSISEPQLEFKDGRGTYVAARLLYTLSSAIQG